MLCVNLPALHPVPCDGAHQNLRNLLRSAVQRVAQVGQGQARRGLARNPPAGGGAALCKKLPGGVVVRVRYAGMTQRRQPRCGRERVRPVLSMATKTNTASVTLRQSLDSGSSLHTSISRRTELRPTSTVWV